MASCGFPGCNATLAAACVGGRCYGCQRTALWHVSVVRAKIPRCWWCWFYCDRCVVGYQAAPASYIVKALPSVLASQAPSVAVAVTAVTITTFGPEPNCTCPMHVGACVSIGHRVGCLYVDWNQKRLAALKAPKTAPTAALVVPTQHPQAVVMPAAACVHDWAQFRYGSASVNPGLISGAQACRKCLEVACYNRTAGTRCVPGVHGPSPSENVFCGKLLPSNIATILP